jgi:transcriptional regulator with XRE-family HTH domain
MPTPTAYGQYLKSAREGSAMTQEDLAKRLRVTTSYISDLENDRRAPSLPLLIKIANALDTGLDRLVGRKP